MRRPHDPGMKHGKSPSTSFHNNENHESNDAHLPPAAEDLAFSDLATHALWSRTIGLVGNLAQIAQAIFYLFTSFG
jgi:hypothetical protein